MRIGIFGGTFDPVHLGHLILAESCREQCSLDEIWFLPAKIPPHKQHRAITDSQHRVAMLELATAGHAKFRISTMELDREGPSFTVTTLEILHQTHPQHEWLLLLGADSIHDFPTWKEPARIAELARIVAVNRGDAGLPSLESRHSELFGGKIPPLVPVTMPPVAISASDLRDRIRQGRSIRYLVPHAVAAYIQQHGLYAESGE